MSNLQNNGGEYQIPFGGQHPDFELSIKDEYDALIQQNLGNIEKIYNAEQPINPVSKQLFGIGEDLASARADYLDRRHITDVASDNVVRSIAKRIVGKKPQFFAKNEDELKHLESEIGGRLFGEVGAGERIEFFNDDANNWYFYKENADGTTMTLHYEIHPNGIFRIKNNDVAGGEMICGQELHNFVTAAGMYHDQVAKMIYGYIPSSKNLN